MKILKIINFRVGTGTRTSPHRITLFPVTACPKNHKHMPCTFHTYWHSGYVQKSGLEFKWKGAVSATSREGKIIYAKFMLGTVWPFPALRRRDLSARCLREGMRGLGGKSLSVVRVSTLWEVGREILNRRGIFLHGACKHFPPVRVLRFRAARGQLNMTRFDLHPSSWGEEWGTLPPCCRSLIEDRRG